jgi:transcription antitermination factor NusG
MSWAVATTVPSCEGIASRELAALGAETFAPRYRRHASAPTQLLIPGYVFVRPVACWSAVLGARGVRGVLGLDGPEGEALLVREYEMARLTDQLDADGILTDRDPFGPGARVRSRVLDWLGVVEGIHSTNRFAVRFEAMGRFVRATASRADLVLA